MPLLEFATLYLADLAKGGMFDVPSSGVAWFAEPGTRVLLEPMGAEGRRVIDQKAGLRGDAAPTHCPWRIRTSLTLLVPSPGPSPFSPSTCWVPARLGPRTTDCIVIVPGASCSPAGGWRRVISARRVDQALLMAEAN